MLKINNILDCRIIDGTPTILREGFIDDFIYIDSLRKKEGQALGFIPKAVFSPLSSVKTI